MTKQSTKPCKACLTLRPVNRKGYCESCAFLRARLSAIQMKLKSGPFYDRWRSAMKAYLERTEA